MLAVNWANVSVRLLTRLYCCYRYHRIAFVLARVLLSMFVVYACC